MLVLSPDVSNFQQGWDVYYSKEIIERELEVKQLVMNLEHKVLTLVHPYTRYQVPFYLWGIKPVIYQNIITKVVIPEPGPTVCVLREDSL